MSTHGIAEETAASARKAVDRSTGGGRSGSVILVLLVAVILVAAATGFVVLGRGNAGPTSSASWRCSPPSACSRCSRSPPAVAAAGGEGANPLLKSVVDEAFDGFVVTDADGRVIYANPAYLDLIDAVDPKDLRPVERVFIGDADASEAIYRLLKAAREGKRLQEEVRVAATKGRPARWLRLRVRPLGERGRNRMTVWALADVTRERERQENVFQELQHAVDYLDHARPAFRPNARATWSISTPRWPIGSIRIWRKSAPAA